MNKIGQSNLNLKNDLFVSIIIPVRNGEDRIGNILDSLRGQTYPQEFFEVIVVDNMSTDGTKKVVEEYIQKNKRIFKYVFEGVKGHSFARNRGIKTAKGDIITFTDDDCVAADDWIEQIINTFKKTNALAVQGKVVLATPIPRENWIPEEFIRQRLAHVDHGEKDFQLDTQDLVGANMSFRKTIFEEYGIFNTNVGLSQDTEFSRKLQKSHVPRFYSSQSKIFHHYSLKRLEEKSFYKQSYNWGKSNMILEPQGIPDFQYLTYLLKNICVNEVQLIKLKFKPDRVEFFLLKCKIYSLWGRVTVLFQRICRFESLFKSNEGNIHL